MSYFGVAFGKPISETRPDGSRIVMCSVCGRYQMEWEVVVNIATGEAFCTHHQTKEMKDFLESQKGKER